MRMSRIWFDRPGVRWARVLVIVVAATAGVALWLANERDLWGDAPPATVAIVPAMPASAALARRAPIPDEPAQRGPAAGEAAATKSPSSEVRVCGLGSVPVGRDGPDAAAHRLRHERTKPVMARWLEALHNGAEPRGKAVAPLLAALLATPILPAAQTACRGEPDCPNLQAGIGAAAWVAQRERLAELAIGGRDAGVLGIAIQACATGAAPAETSACARLAPEDWTAVDTVHAEPWLMLADQALSRGENDLADEAFRRALSLPFGRVAEQSLFAAVLAAQPPDAGLQERLQMGDVLNLLRSGWHEVGASTVMSQCSAAAMKTPARRELCQQLAEHLVLRGATLQDVASGRALGQRLGWFPERMAAAGKDLDAAQRILAGFSGAEAYDCAAAQRQVDYLAALAAQGELAAVRKLATSLPRP